MVGFIKDKTRVWFFEDNKCLGGFDFQYGNFYGSLKKPVANKPKFFAGEPKNEMDTATLIWRAACNNAYEVSKDRLMTTAGAYVSFIERCAAVGIIAGAAFPSIVFQKIFPKIKLDKTFVDAWNEWGEGVELNQNSYGNFLRLQAMKKLRASYSPAVSAIIAEIRGRFPEFAKETLDAFAHIIQKHHLYFISNSTEKLISWTKMKLELNEPLSCDQSFFLDYNTTVKRYNAYLNKKTDEDIRANNNLPYLYYKDSDWIVVPLLSAEDFHREAQQQHNCVERIYMEQVQKGRTHVVSVRQAFRSEHSYITCEVKNGKIEQWLTANNTCPPKCCDNIKHTLALQFMKGWKELGR